MTSFSAAKLLVNLSLALIFGDVSLGTIQELRYLPLTREMLLEQRQDLFLVGAAAAVLAARASVLADGRGRDEGDGTDEDEYADEAGEVHGGLF
ncbi:hypothetical protein BDK51DRAFT_49934 [Blyttiomyces helicus]|uniref:Uncharacterized protein n=1 Tax=Blyttiomyces helicus TaxID=388810 RepID=A0A4P9W5A4_9FUNG|nr:hypothetical protein BDK51DRAFT_49934 [Blyttiomyces helicus]|eukprot:RKO86078.1 hypothetical protein BDK51DRAFT_49934 [Blyttiomyces helicus]